MLRYATATAVAALLLAVGASGVRAQGAPAADDPVHAVIMKGVALCKAEPLELAELERRATALGWRDFHDMAPGPLQAAKGRAGRQIVTPAGGGETMVSLIVMDDPAGPYGEHAYTCSVAFPAAYLDRAADQAAKADGNSYTAGVARQIFYFRFDQGRRRIMGPGESADEVMAAGKPLDSVTYRRSEKGVGFITNTDFRPPAPAPHA